MAGDPSPFPHPQSFAADDPFDMRRIADSVVVVKRGGGPQPAKCGSENQRLHRWFQIPGRSRYRE